MKALKGKCINMTDKIINIVLQKSFKKKTTTELGNFAHSPLAHQGDECYPQHERSLHHQEHHR